jgi:uroporphyrinogen decarboxylase
VLPVELTIKSDDNYGRVMASLVNEPEDIDTLELYNPFDLKERPHFTKGLVENISMVANTLDEDFHVLGMSWGSFTTAAHIRRAENIMMDINYGPDLVRKLVAKTAGFCEQVQLRCIDAGATALWMSDPTASEDMISRYTYREFAFRGHQARLHKRE